MKNLIRITGTILLAIVYSFLTGCATTNALSKKGTTTTIILIRHADRNDQHNLTEKGKNRAKERAKSLKDFNISAIYSPGLKRNLDTVQPLANHLDIDITPAPRFSLFSVDTIAGEILDKHGHGFERTQKKRT